MEDYYCVDDMSDNEDIDSSDDEDFRSLFTALEDSEEEEDFESEMERERLSHVNGIHKSVVPSNGTNAVIKREESDSNSAQNEDLLYDPKSDELDQKWLDSQRPSNSSGTKNQSDATLNCPACMALLCVDCQRHQIYRTQYRAMFVFNCRIDLSQRLEYKPKKRKRRQTGEETTRKDYYYSVFCTQCNTQVAVYDKEEVYHFFGVLASF